MSTLATTKATSAYALGDPVIQYPHRPGLSAMLVLTADILGLTFVLSVFLGNTMIGRYATQRESLPVLQLLPLFLLLYWLFGSYPGVSVNPVPEIRRISLANASAFLCISVILAVHHEALISHLVCLLACAGSSIVTLAMRALVRNTGSRFDWWGYPVVLIGAGTVALTVLLKLISQPHLGLRPVAVVADQVVDREIEGIPVFPSVCLRQIASGGIKHAIVAAPELSESEFVDVIEQGGDIFPHLIVIPDTDFIWKVGSYTCDLMGILGLEVRNNLLDSGSRIIKRAIDLASSALLTLFLLPLLVIIALMIVVESGFPVFYFQQRLGYGGRLFHMWKFRTMVQDNAMILEHCLATNSERRREWAEFQKLRDDPRVTHVGRLLRRTSLDELPQLWNIIRGEMSMVGPRPYLGAQMPKYHAAYSVYVKTVPGLTGLWQVSGRNRTTIAERIAYDIYYVRNWSVWMDIYLLAKTVGILLSGDGAY
jgi:Undecaprenyl-phosphate galactose phosphotransferase WbaP